MVSGLQWWLAADHISGVAAGGAVAAWNDSSGNGYNLAQGTGSAQPTWQVNVLNGRPVVRFDGGDSMTAGNVFSINDTLTLIVVYIVGSVSARQTILGQENAAGAFQYEINSNGSSSSIGRYGTIINGTAISGSTGAHYPIGSPVLQAYTRAGAGATHTLYEYGYSNVLATNSTTSYSGDGDKTIGRRAAGVQGFVGDLAELMLWNVVLTAAQFSKANIYLGRKYGLLNPSNLSY